MQQQESGQRLDPRKKNTVVIIFKLLKYHRGSGETGTLVTLLHQEKLIYIAMDFMDEFISFNKQPIISALDQLPFNFTTECQTFIKNVNTKAMEAFKGNGTDDQLNLIIKAVDLLMTKSLAKYIQPIQILGQLKVLTFNNLACIYQLKKKLTLALKSVNFAIEIEQRLLNEKFGDVETSIISTKLNKVALLSQSNKHDAAIDLLSKDILESCNKLILEVQNLNPQTMDQSISNSEQIVIDQQACETLQQQQQQRIIDVKRYKAYTLYNLGVENEYLFFGERAAYAYNEALKVAKELNQTILVNQIENALEKFKK